MILSNRAYIPQNLYFLKKGNLYMGTKKIVIGFNSKDTCQYVKNNIIPNHIQVFTSSLSPYKFRILKDKPKDKKIKPVSELRPPNSLSLQNTHIINLSMDVYTSNILDNKLMIHVVEDINIESDLNEIILYAPLRLEYK